MSTTVIFYAPGRWRGPDNWFLYRSGGLVRTTCQTAFQSTELALCASLDSDLSSDCNRRLADLATQSGKLAYEALVDTTHSEFHMVTNLLCNPEN